MKLFFTCKSCNRDNFLKSRASDRAILAAQLDPVFTKVCKFCDQENEVHVNRVYASENKLIVIPILVIGITIMVVLTTVLMKSYWRDDIGKDLFALSAITLGFVIPLLVMFTALSSYSKKIRIFNSYRT